MTDEAVMERFTQRWETEMLPLLVGSIEATLMQGLKRNIQELNLVIGCEHCRGASVGPKNAQRPFLGHRRC